MIKVFIELNKGVVYVASAREDIEVIVADYDNQDSEEAYIAERIPQPPKEI